MSIRSTSSDIPRRLAGPDFPVDPNHSARAPRDLRANKIFTRNFDLTNARDPAVEIKGMSGSFLWALGASSAQATLDVFFIDTTGEAFPFKRGLFIGGIAFQSIIIGNTAQASQSIKMAYGWEQNPSGLRIENIPFAQILPTVIDTVADIPLVAGAATQIVAADPGRRNVWISNLVVNGREIRVGDNLVTASRGRELLPGESMELKGTEAIFAFNPNLSVQNIGVTLEKD